MNFDTNGFDTEEIENIPKRKRKEPSDSAEKRRRMSATPKKDVSAEQKSRPAEQKKQAPHASPDAPKRSHRGEFHVRKEKTTAIKNPDSVLNISLSYIVPFIAIFMIFALFTNSGAFFGNLIRFLCFGLFSHVAYALPFVLIFLGVTWRSNIRNKTVLRRALSTLITFIFVSSLLYTFDPVFEQYPPYHLGDIFRLFFSWSAPRSAIHGGGFFGSTLGWLLDKMLGTVGIWMVVILAILLYFVLYFNFNPWLFAKTMAKRAQVKRLDDKEKRAQKSEKQAYSGEQIYGGRKEEHTIPAVEEAKIKEPEQFAIGAPFAQPAKIQKAEQIDSHQDKIDKISDAMEYGNEQDEIFTDAIQENAFDGVSSGKIVGNKQDRSGFDSYGDDDDEYKKPKMNFSSDDDDDESNVQSYDELHSMIKRESTPNKSKLPKPKTQILETDDDDEDEDDELITQVNKKPVAIAKKISSKSSTYKFPPLSLLRDIKMESASAIPLSEDPVALKLHQTLATFNVKTAVTNVARGPRITRYELVPESGIRIKSIANLVDDISLALATAGIRIEAPIPGKAAVGVEVPNARSQTVGLRALLDNAEFKNAPAKTTICLGADISGEPVYADLAKMPHLLIAGATGMGKSVCINAVITSLLYKANPEEVKLILVDPKKVELSVYSGIPHLLIPVVSDPAQAAGALSWAVNEMESRFDKLEEKGVRNIKGYNAAIKDDPNEKPMCQIVIIIDELADLMMSSPDSVETSICRIAQKARAAGIHLIIGTQRPSVDVITGLIKANIPSRIAFHVSSQVDSRTILDVGGAEKLLNNGDMLFSFAGVMKPKRVQGAFLDDDEVANVTKFLRENTNGSTYNDEIVAEIQREAEKCMQGKKKSESFDDEDGGLDGILDDPKFQAAVDVAFDANKISTSLLQRKLKIGFGRASRYIDAMCEMGIVSEPDGQKPREVLMTRSEYYERENRLSQ